MLLAFPLPGTTSLTETSTTISLTRRRESAPRKLKFESQILENLTSFLNRYNVNNEEGATEKRFDGLSLFLDNVLPAWEDEVNAQGGEFRIDFKASSLTLVQTFWETLIFDVLTSEFPETDMLAGVRMLDKSRGDQGSYRIEIWTKFDDAKSEMG